MVWIFLISRVQYQPKMEGAALKVYTLFREFERQRERAVFIKFDFWCVKMVYIDSAWRELSSGGHIVILVKIWILMSNSGSEAESGLAGRFLDPFLAETICEKSSNDADYASNR